MAKDRTIRFRTDQVLVDELDAAAAITGLGRSAVIRRAIRNGLIATLRDALPAGVGAELDDRLVDAALRELLRTVVAGRAEGRETGPILAHNLGDPLQRVRDFTLAAEEQLQTTESE